MGFQRTYAHAIVFGPQSHGGIGAIDLRTEQGMMIINEVMRTNRSPGHGQDILRIFLRTFQHASGLSKPLLEYLNARAPHLEGHYYVYLRNFLAKHKIQLELACVKRPTPERAGDHFIMDRACSKTVEELSDASIRTINYCRCYLQVHQLSDICTADGNYILTSVLQGHRSEGQSASRLEEIIQDRPADSYWNVWRKFLHPLCHDKGKGKGNQLLHNLGHWKTTLQTSNRLWPHYYSISTNKLYQGYRKHKHNHKEYQFDEYGGSDDELFDYKVEQ